VPRGRCRPEEKSIKEKKINKKAKRILEKGPEQFRICLTRKHPGVENWNSSGRGEPEQNRQTQAKREEGSELPKEGEKAWTNKKMGGGRASREKQWIRQNLT